MSALLGLVYIQSLRNLGVFIYYFFYLCTLLNDIQLSYLKPAQMRRLVDKSKNTETKTTLPNQLGLLNECPDYGTKHSDDEVPIILELWGMGSTPSLPSLPGPPMPWVVAPDRALSMG